MAKRRKAGDWVILDRCSGFYTGGPLIGQIDPHEKNDGTPCILDCGDPNCLEWANIFVPRPDAPDGIQDLYHVSECQMSDVPENWEPPKDWKAPNIYAKD